MSLQKLSDDLAIDIQIETLKNEVSIIDNDFEKTHLSKAELGVLITDLQNLHDQLED